MAKRKKTGGRDFKPGNPGRRPGSKNRIPGGVKKNLIDHLRTLEDERGPELSALFDHILSKGGREAIALLELALGYLHGRPVQRISVEPPQSIEIIVPVVACPHCGRSIQPPPPEKPRALAPAPEVGVIEVEVQAPASIPTFRARGDRHTKAPRRPVEEEE